MSSIGGALPLLGSPARRAGDGLALPLWRSAGVLSVVAAWLLFRPYRGIVHDARHYMGEALAKLAPDTVGRDYMFQLDGQFGFTGFGHVAHSLTGLLGAGAASLLIVAAGLACWIAAAAALAGRLAGGRLLLWASLIAAAALPADYAAYQGYLSFGEALATPRVFAEAAVLAALAAFLGDRRWLAAGLVALAAVFHPVMALPGLGVMLLSLGAEDRRWWLVVIAGAVMALVAAALGAPLAERLFQVMDPTWAEVVETRSTLVFPTEWELENFTRIAVHAVTVICAALLLQGRARALLISSVVVAALGLGGGALLGDGLRSLLVIQMQPWRALWLIAVLGAVCLPICAHKLWERGWTARIAVAGLGLGWTSLGEPLYASVGAATALVALAAVQRGRSLPLAMPLAFCLFALASVRIAAPELSRLSALAAWMASVPADHVQTPLWWLKSPSLGLLAAAAATAFAVRQRPPVRQAPGVLTATVAAGAALAGLLAAGVAWDARKPPRRVIESAATAASLRAMLDARPGEVLWIGGDIEAPILAGRANWWAAYQCAPTVFSQPLAAAWSARHAILVDAGLVARSACVAPARMTPEDISERRVVITTAKVERFCRRADAPAWVIVSFLRGSPAPGHAATIWRLGAAQHQGLVTDEGYQWKRLDGYAVIPCRGSVAAATRPASPLERIEAPA